MIYKVHIYPDGKCPKCDSVTTLVGAKNPEAASRTALNMERFAGCKVAKVEPAFPILQD